MKLAEELAEERHQLNEENMKLGQDLSNIANDRDRLSREVLDYTCFCILTAHTAS